MNDTTDIVVAQHRNFLSLDHANAAGYFRPWQLKRRDLKPDGSEPRASLVDPVPQDDLDDDVFGRSFYLRCPDTAVIGDTICTNRRPLYHISQTKPYHPTDRTRAIWTYHDVFVPAWRRYRRQAYGRWCEVEASRYPNGLNEAIIKDHLRGWDRCQVYAGRSTRFVAAMVTGASAEQALAKAEEIKERLFAQKWLCQVSAEGITVYWVFRERHRTEYEVGRLRGLLSGLPATIGPTSKVAIDLPLCRGCLTFVDRLLPTVHRQTGPEDDVVGLADWITEEGGSPRTADVLAAYRRQQDEVENHHQMDLLSIAVQFDQDDTQDDPPPAEIQEQELDDFQRELLSSLHSTLDQIQANQPTETQRQEVDGDIQHHQPEENEQTEDHHQMDLLSIAVQFEQTGLKNRCWRVITGFFQGRESLPLNTGILLGARILFFEGVAADTAKSILLDYCRAIPNPTSSRLTDPGSGDVLKKDIGRAVDAVYQNNGRQQDAGTSSRKMQKAVAAWRSKGLIFSDKTTWDTTYGYAAMPHVEFTEQEICNIRAYLVPLLSSRDTKGREPLAVALLLVDCVIRLVAAMERQGRNLATSYLQKYIKGETGISCENKIKFGKLKEALISLGFIKVLRQGYQGYGATYYGLAGRLAEQERPAENRTLVNEDVLDTVIRPIEEQMDEEEEDHQMDLLSIAVQFTEARPERALRLTGDPVFNSLLARQREPPEPRQGDRFTGDPIFDELLAESDGLIAANEG